MQKILTTNSRRKALKLFYFRQNKEGDQEKRIDQKQKQPLVSGALISFAAGGEERISD